MRIFASIATEAEAIALATKRVEDNWESFFERYCKDKAEAIAAIVKDYKIGQTPIIKII
jgi:hypothetical protein